jgi:hypothetical protein
LNAQTVARTGAYSNTEYEVENEPICGSRTAVLLFFRKVFIRVIVLCVQYVEFTVVYSRDGTLTIKMHTYVRVRDNREGTVKRVTSADMVFLLFDARKDPNFFRTYIPRDCNLCKRK